jgi:hypothetical protein
MHPEFLFDCRDEWPCRSLNTAGEKSAWSFHFVTPCTLLCFFSGISFQCVDKLHDCPHRTTGWTLFLTEYCYSELFAYYGMFYKTLWFSQLEVVLLLIL